MQIKKLPTYLFIGAIVFCATISFWAVKEYQNPYIHTWFYRTFIQDGFNAEITFKVEFDHKPYEIQRIIRCRKQRVDGDWASRKYKFFADYMSFGTTADTGEGIIMTTPAVCQVPDPRFFKGEAWEKPVPAGYLPLAAISDRATDPTMITVYGSRQAYKSPAARLKIISIKLNSPSGFGRTVFGADDRDQFAFFGSSSEYENSVGYEEGTLRTPREEWLHVTFVAIPEEVWASKTKGLELNNATIQKLKSAQEATYLSFSETMPIGVPDINRRQREFDLRSPLFGSGLLPGPLLGGRTSTRLSDTMYFDEMLPYRLVDGVWLPDVDAKGMVLLFNNSIKDNLKPDQYADPSGHKWHFSRQINLGNGVLTYREGAKISLLPRPAIFLPSNHNIYFPIPWRFRFIHSRREAKMSE